MWFGKQAVDDDAAQVGLMVAEMLDLPCVGVVAAFALDGEKATVEREIEGGREVVEVTLPAVFTTDKGLNEPRYRVAQGHHGRQEEADRREARRGGRAGARGASRSSCPPARKAGRIVGEGVAAVPELIRVLREEVQILGRSDT